MPKRFANSLGGEPIEEKCCRPKQAAGYRKANGLWRFKFEDKVVNIDGEILELVVSGTRAEVYITRPDHPRTIVASAPITRMDWVRRQFNSAVILRERLQRRHSTVHVLSIRCGRGT